MILLLALCGWILGGDEGALWALRGGTPMPDATAITPEAMRQRFGARLVLPGEMPALFEMLEVICRRAGLPRMPALYLIPEPRGMNAYALGGPSISAITVTEGLLQGLTVGELRAILAHEVGHIRNNDGWALTLAETLHRATALTSLLGLLCLRGRDGRSVGTDAPLATLLNGAPAIGRLLHLALSRIREFDADATAMELVDDPQALVDALHKLERHHGGDLAPLPSDQMLLRWLRSHPATWERVRTLLALAGAH